MLWGREELETEVHSSLTQCQTLITDKSLILSLFYFPFRNISQKMQNIWSGKLTMRAEFSTCLSYKPPECLRLTNFCVNIAISRKLGQYSNFTDDDALVQRN